MGDVRNDLRRFRRVGSSGFSYDGGIVSSASWVEVHIWAPVINAPTQIVRDRLTDKPEELSTQRITGLPIQETGSGAQIYFSKNDYEASPALLDQPTVLPHNTCLQRVGPPAGAIYVGRRA